MITLFISAVLLMIGVPAFKDVFVGAKVGSIANDLMGSVQLARSEAIKRNAVVTLCTSDDGSTCAASGGWEQGWVVLDAASNVIQAQEAAPTGFHVTESGGGLSISFQPIGVGATTATFTVCRASPVGKQERVVSVFATGMANVTTTEAGSCP